MSSFFPCFPFLRKTMPLVLAAVVMPAAHAQIRTVSTQHRDTEHALPRTLVAGPKALQAKLRADSVATTVSTVDVDGDGVADLLTGYKVGEAGALVLQRGSRMALDPFEEKGTVIALPVRPDLLATGDLRGAGHNDVFLAQRGDTTAYLLPGSGDGSFGEPQAVALTGTVQAVGAWRDGTGRLQLVASVCSSTGCGVQLLASDGSEGKFVPTGAAVVALKTAQLQGGKLDDLLALTAVGVTLIDGDSIASGKPRTQQLSIASPVAVEAGHFLYDKRTYTQIAVLDAAGTLHLLAHEGLDRSVYTAAELHARREALSLQSGAATVQAQNVSRLPWTEVETLADVATGANVVMLRGRFGGALDDLAVMAGNQFVTVSHAQVTESGVRQSVPTVTTDSSNGTTTAAVAVHANADSRQGVVTIGNAVQALYTVPPTNRTLNVNTTADAQPTTTSKNLCIAGSAGCTLRSAVAVANDDAGSTGTAKVDTINVPAGTYTLSATNSGSTMDVNGDLDYHLNIYGSVNIVGAGAATTLISGGNLDKVFSINPDLNKTLNVYFSNLTIQNGVEKNARGGYDYYGGLMDADLGGTGTLGFSSVTLTAGLSQSSEGGAMYLSNVAANAPAGLFEMDNCTISNNKSPYGGGAIYLPNYMPTTLANDTFSGNIADPSTYAAAGTTTAIGGALQLVPVPSNGSTAPAIAITNSSFSSNSARTGGGAIYLTNGGFTISGTSFTQNTATTSAYGGAIFMRNGAFPGSIMTSTFVSNTAPTGGGAICVDGTTSQSTYDALTVKYSRFHGNGPTTAVLASCTTGYSTVTATDNWWGCNGAATGTGCDVAAKLSNGTLTVSPYTTLTLQLSSTTPAYGATLAATASLGQDSASTVYTQANDAAYAGVPAALAITQKSGAVTQAAPTALGAISSPSTFYAAITASTTANSLGAGTATATVDGTAVTANFTVQGADLTVASTHTGDFKSGDTADSYTLTVTNGGSIASSGTVTVVDAVPFGFTVTAISGAGWSCTVSTATCTRSSALSASASYPAITVTVSVASSIRGVLANSVTVSGGSDVITTNNTATDNTNVIAPATLQMAFSPGSVGKNVNSALTFTLTNYADNPATLTNVSFTVTLPSGVTAPFALGTTSCTSGFIVANNAALTFSGASLAPGASCTASVNVQGTVVGQYTISSSSVTAANSNPGSAASATLNIVVVPTQLVFTTTPSTPVAAGSSANAVTVVLEDSTGSVATTNSTTQVVLNVSGPNSFSATYFATASAGVAVFSATQFPPTKSGTYTYTASAAGMTNAVATQKITGGTAVSISVTGLGTYTAPQRYDFATVTLHDQFGNVADGFSGFVYLTSSDPQAVFFPSSHFFTSVDAGTRSFIVTLNTAGTQSVTAEWSGPSGSQTGILVQDAVWLLNTNGTMVRADSAGTTTANPGSSSAPGTLGFASDHSGSVWLVQNNSTTVSLYTAAGVLQSSFNGATAGVSAPSAVAIDGLGRSWIANGNGSVSVLSNAGDALSPPTGLARGMVNAPNAILIDHAGSVVVLNSGNNTVTKIIGGAAPVATPAAAATRDVQQGVRP